MLPGSLVSIGEGVLPRISLPRQGLLSERAAPSGPSSASAQDTDSQPERSLSGGGGGVDPSPVSRLPCPFPLSRSP